MLTRLITALFILVWTSSAFSATVTTVKGKQLLINLDGDAASAGEEFYLINPETSKKAAIIRIKKTSKGKALAEVVKGKAATGYTLQAKAPSAMSADAPVSSQKSESVVLSTSKNSYGIMGGFIMNSMSANVSYNDGVTTVSSSSSMSGTGFGVGGFYDYSLSPDWVARGYAGMEQFVAAGSAAAAACKGTTDCNANINYLSMYGLMKWYLLQGSFRGWLGGGLGYLMALSKSSSALNESQISANQVFTFAFGGDIQMSRQNYIPVSIEYNMFPDSPTVKASQILIKAGWAWNL